MLTDLEIASRLSYFLWSSGPDDELLALAERNRLNDPAILEPVSYTHLTLPTILLV